MQACRSRPSRRPWRITTAIAGRADQPTSSRGCATTSARIPIAAPIARARITHAGRRTAQRSGPTRPDRLVRVLPEEEEEHDEGKGEGRQPPVGDERVGEGDARDRRAKYVHAAEHDREPEPARRVAHLPAQSAWPVSQARRTQELGGREGEDELHTAA